MQFFADTYLAILWLACGIVIGYVASLLLGPIHSRRQADRARLDLAQSQQRRTLERLRLSHQELTTQLEEAEKRHTQVVASLKRVHTAQLRAMAEESNRMLGRLNVASNDSGRGVEPGVSFQQSRFDESRFSDES